MKKHIYPFLVSALIIAFSFSCATTRKGKSLDPESEDFFSHVRYIITSEESKIFLELPPSARKDFIEDFWERRDPTPETKNNEYKEAYFQRIDEANRLFRGPRPGWLQDRGRNTSSSALLMSARHIQWDSAPSMPMRTRES